ncbi:TonB-dependent receptor [Marinirhabdus gelatinilytica]|uniref:Outer membrane cobalamin receptor n=1 Tax=Marinirhabdus gelatinilytica TaxID=1703343 RepID=A0A370QFJ6_9FLAO|nr:TonB-dependent receptor [Marinirhabdus gelatinilytica]RDK87135.1 outer membrane cobalamin receptor [Marinirhabdus gelatinilytica]
MSRIHFIIIITLTLFSFGPLRAQQTISGTVLQKNGTPIFGANVYLEGTYDGASTDEQGNFSFKTSETGVQTLVVSYVSFQPFMMAGDVSQLRGVTITLKEDFNSLDTVVISAGSLEASDNSKVSVLKPLDVVTTASALGDFVGALQTLPGTTTVAEDGRLFVRGGDAGETQIFIDGIRVFTPYTPTTNNIPTRGRYSPFLFDGITFSTGGYSAEYGQALSSVLLLNTVDEPDQEKTEIALMTVGGGLGNTQKWENSSLSVNASYINLAPYIAALPGRNDWQKPFESIAGETVFRKKLKNGLFKLYAAYDTTNFELTQEDIDVAEGVSFKLKNNNFYTNASYRGDLGRTWKIQTGGSFTHSKNELGIIGSDIDNTENSFHFKLKFRKRFSNQVKLSFGAEQFLTDFSEDFSNPSVSANYGYNSSISAAFAETDIIFSKEFALKAGVRGEYSELFNQFTVSPRASVAYKTGKDSQLSVAYGDFYQQPFQDVLKFQQDLEAQKTQHYILNYQYVANNRIFRAEAYQKQYSNLVTFNTPMPGFESNFTNNGDGFAQGIDLFWRDNQSIKNVDYWVSYSLLDTERLYQNFPTAATPSFANTHNASVVTKYWIEDWKSQLGFSYQYGSGRTYTNPNVEGFLQEKTKDFNSLSLNWAYLIDPQKILYVSVNNVFGFNNINGYQYASTPDASGNFNRRALRPAQDQFFFVGFFWTISEDGTDNQLDNL